LAGQDSHLLDDKQSFMKASHPPIPFDPQGLVALNFLSACATAASSAAWQRPVMKTYAPAATKRWAAANPMPLLPPVMTATLPVRLSVVVVICRCSFLQSRCEAIRSHERGVHLYDNITYVPAHTEVRNLATCEDSERCSGGSVVANRW
jgi:hypothetical protein